MHINVYYYLETISMIAYVLQSLNSLSINLDRPERLNALVIKEIPPKGVID